MPSRAKTQLLLAVNFLIEILLATVFIIAMYQFDNHTKYHFVWTAVSFLCGGIFVILGIISVGICAEMDVTSDGWEDILFRKCFKNYEDLTQNEHWHKYKKNED